MNKNKTKKWVWWQAYDSTPFNRQYDINIPRNQSYGEGKFFSSVTGKVTWLITISEVPFHHSKIPNR